MDGAYLPASMPTQTLRHGMVHASGLRDPSLETTGERMPEGHEMSQTIHYVECAHCGETVGSHYVTCPYCGYRLVDAKTLIWRNFNA